MKKGRGRGKREGEEVKDGEKKQRDGRGTKNREKERGAMRRLEWVYFPVDVVKEQKATI